MVLNFGLFGMPVFEIGKEVDILCAMVMGVTVKKWHCSFCISETSLDLTLCKNPTHALCFNPLAYTAACEADRLARSINTQPAVRRNSETNPTSQHNRGMY